MEIIKLIPSDIKKLSQYELHESIDNSESKLYLYKTKEMLKIFKSNEKNYYLNKLFILNRLFYIKNYIDLEELVMPNKLIKIGKNKCGYTMDFIENNTNISLVLNSNKVSIEDKLYFIKKIGKAIEKTINNDILKENNFYLGDIHEGNFIYDNKNNKMKIVDLDSSYIPGMTAPNSKFLTYNDKLWTFNEKYPIDKNNNHIPNMNTVILSYIYILLNFLTEEYSPDINKTNFVKNINILSHVGFDKKLLDSIFNIYLPTDNFLDFELIDSITPNLVLKYREIKNAKK